MIPKTPNREGVLGVWLSSSECAELLAERDTLRRERDVAVGLMNVALDQRETAEAELDALQARVGKVREALDDFFHENNIAPSYMLRLALAALDAEPKATK